MSLGLLVHRYLITIQLTDFLSAILVTIQLMDTYSSFECRTCPVTECLLLCIPTACPIYQRLIGSSIIFPHLYSWNESWQKSLFRCCRCRNNETLRRFDGRQNDDRVETAPNEAWTRSKRFGLELDVAELYIKNKIALIEAESLSWIYTGVRSVDFSQVFCP